MKLVYEGSVKNLWEADGRQNCLEFEYTDAYSVFDWGRMPDALSAKGESLAALGAYFFNVASDVKTWRSLNLARRFSGLETRLKEVLTRELSVLEREGLRHHFLDRPKANRLRVERVAAVAPQTHKLGGQTLYHYRNNVSMPSTEPRLIPLEVVFRFGVPKGSSLLERMTPEYAKRLGLQSIPKEGDKFETPILEFFSKLEDTDRFLSWEQALNYSGLDYAVFEKLVARSLCLAVWLSNVFETKKLELWDGKFEWALISGELTLVDSIGPDELRLLDPETGTQISKEFLRLFYRDTPWFEAVKRAKYEAATDPNLDWKNLVRSKVGEPPALSREFREAADLLYPSLALAITGENPNGLGIALDRVIERIRACRKQ